jgi:hypothetical protein
MVDYVSAFRSDLAAAEPLLWRIRGADAGAHAFSVMAMPRVISLIRPVNEPSRGVAARVGMHAERETNFHGYRHRVYAVSPGDDP